MKIGGDVTPARGKSQIVTITVTNVKGVAVKGVTVRVSGAGAVPRAKQHEQEGPGRAAGAADLEGRADLPRDEVGLPAHAR